MSTDHIPDLTVENEYLQLVRYTPIMQAKKTTAIMASVALFLIQGPVWRPGIRAEYTQSS